MTDHTMHHSYILYAYSKSYEILRTKSGPRFSSQFIYGCYMTCIMGEWYFVVFKIKILRIVKITFNGALLHDSQPGCAIVHMHKNTYTYDSFQ